MPYARRTRIWVRGRFFKLRVVSTGSDSYVNTATPDLVTNGPRWRRERGTISDAGASRVDNVSNNNNNIPWTAMAKKRINPIRIVPINRSYDEFRIARFYT